jgi:hypothetical protein
VQVCRSSMSRLVVYQSTAFDWVLRVISSLPQDKLPTKVMSLHAHHRHGGEGVVDRIEHLFG